MKAIPNPYGIPVEFALLDAKEHGLSSPVIRGEELYIAAKVEKQPHGEEAFGFSFEKMVLYGVTPLGYPAGEMCRRSIWELPCAIS